MNSWKRCCCQTLAGICMGSMWTQTWAQATSVARDIQSNCVVSDIPALVRLSVSWTGDCIAGKATGVGDVIAFSNGELRYILRGQFSDGRIDRQDQLRQCIGDRCADQVAPAVVRQHMALSRQNQDSPLTPPSTVNSAAITPTIVIEPSQVAPVAVPLISAGIPAMTPVASAEIRAEDAVYRGRFELNKQTLLVSGQGRIEFFDGRSFEGQLEDGRKVGFGTYIWSNGQRYRGNWRDDQPDGEGEWTSSAGDRYLGGFIKGKRQGQGRMVYADKSEYNGTWRDDLPTGAGEQKFLNGNVYSGEFLAGMQTGIGTLTHRNGDRYTGNWLNGRRHGKGVAQWNDGQSYDGTWVGDQATGQGVIKFASGDSYTGEVSDGQPQGKGIYTWGSGDKFEGEFSAGKPTANGQMTFFIVPTAEIAATVPLTDASAVSGTGSGAVTSSISKVTLCSRGYNAARSVVALKQFIDAFPADECGRHALARQKMAVLEENERRVSRELADRQGQAKALVGLVVAYRQEYVHCVPDQDEKCQNIVYVFEVRGKIREVNVARQSVQLQVVEVSGLANDKGAPAKLYSDGRVAANQAFRKRVMGSIQTKSKNEVGLEF